jgi:23S rRNA pseudouridine2605 synthase
MTDTPAPPPGDRIAKVIARAGIASRRDAEILIVEGRVAVNGKVIESAALNVTPTDRVTVDGRPLAAPEPARLWLYHKPSGLVTTARDEQGRDTVFDALPEDMPRVMSVGRLDLNSEGLLLLTNDGDLKRRLELPSTGWLRRYRVRIKGAPTEAQLAALRGGLTIDGDTFQPMQVEFDRQQGANAWLTLGLREGKNREIRRAMESQGLLVNRLIRISYGPFQLGNLAEGAVEEIKTRILRDQLGESGMADDDETPRSPRAPRPGPKGGPKGAPKGTGPRNDKPRGNKPYGDTPRGERAAGDKPRGYRPFKDARGPKPDGPRGAPKGDRPFGKPARTRDADGDARPARDGDRPFRKGPPKDRT